MKEMWLARDYDDRIYLYFGDEPVKDHERRIWMVGHMSRTNFMEIDKRLFPEVQWSDKEPTKVKLIIDE